MCTETQLIDNAIKMEMEDVAQASVQHKDRTKCSRRNNELTMLLREMARAKQFVLRQCLDNVDTHVFVW